MSKHIKVYPNADTRSAGLAEAAKRIEAYLGTIDPGMLMKKRDKVAYLQAKERLDKINETLFKLQGKVKLS